MPGVALFYSIIALFGLIMMYNILPETENRSLEEIEVHFLTKKITDTNIRKLEQMQSFETENKESDKEVSIKSK